MKKRKKILPVTTDVPVYTYTYYGYPHSIIAAEEHTGDYVAGLEIIDYEKYKWTEQFEELDQKQDGNRFRFYSRHPYKENLHGVMSRPLGTVDAIRVRIYYQQYAHPWGAVNLFIDDGEEEKFDLGDDSYSFRLGFFNREGVYFRYHNVPQKLEWNTNSFPVDLMLCRDHEIIEAYLYEGKQQYLLWQKKLPEWKENSWKIGVQVRGNANTYYPWLFRNFIQISCDIHSVNRPIDFFYGVEKDWDFHWINYFLNFDQIPLPLFLHYGVMDFIRGCIDQGKYIELRLDQYDIRDRDEYRQHHFSHQNLIYGYDDSQKLVYLLGYANAGQMVKTKISYADLKYQFVKRNSVSNIYVIEYKQEAYGFEYQGEYMRKMIRQYLESDNSSLDLGHLIEPRRRVYGIACYDELLTEKGMQMLLSDWRVVHLLYEHKALMKERLEYIIFHEAENRDYFNRFPEAYSEVVRRAFNIRSLTVKYELSGEDIIAEKIKEHLIHMCTLEKRVLSDFLSELELC